MFFNDDDGDDHHYHSDLHWSCLQIAAAASIAAYTSTMQLETHLAVNIIIDDHDVKDHGDDAAHSWCDWYFDGNGAIATWNHRKP